MALQKVTVLDKLEVLEDGTLQVRHASYIVDGKERITASMYHRSVFVPGAEVPTKTLGYAKIAAVRDVVWTAAVITAYQERAAAQRRAAGFPVNN